MLVVVGSVVVDSVLVSFVDVASVEVVSEGTALGSGVAVEDGAGTTDEAVVDEELPLSGSMSGFSVFLLIGKAPKTFWLLSG